MPGVFGTVFTDIAKVCAADDPQALSAVTVIFPLKVLAVVLMEFVDEIPVHPEGKVQVYEVAPFTAVTLNVFELAAQILVFPVMLLGIVGAVFTVTAKV